MFHKRPFNPITRVFKTARLPEKGVRTVTKTITQAAKDDIPRDLFKLSINKGFGLSGKPTKVAYDGIQGLLAVATDDGELHVYGQRQIDFVFTLEQKTIIRQMTFVMGKYILLVDQLNRIITISLESREFYKMRTQPFQITCLETDPILPWVLLGLADGTILVYDVVEDRVSNYMINDLQKLNFFKGAKTSEVISIQWNPRDLGTILISYKYVTILYSLVEKAIKQSFVYELPPYAPGGDYSFDVTKRRNPKVIQSLFHPNSLFILTVHDDNSLVFWDVNTGKLIQARTLFDEDINIPVYGLKKLSQPELPHILKASWICQSNSEYTTLLIANGPSDIDSSAQGLVMIDFGRTPFYSFNSYDSVSAYFLKATQQKLLPIQNKSAIRDFVSIATETPFFNGNHNPQMIVVLLHNGEIETLSYPMRHFIHNGALFPQGVNWIWPQTTKVQAVDVNEEVWQHLNNVSQQELGILEGGYLTTDVGNNHSGCSKTDSHTLLITGHSNGMVRVWNTKNDQHNGNKVFEVDTSRVLNIGIGKAVKHISFEAENLEMSVATENGDVVFYKFEANQFYNEQSLTFNRELVTKFRRFSLADTDSVLVNVRDRAPPHIKYGFMPHFAIHSRHGVVTSLHLSCTRFLVIAYHDGYMLVIDLLHDVVIFNKSIRDVLLSQSKYVSAIDISVMRYDDENYSSIILTCGTDLGQMLSFRVIPNGGEPFKLEFLNTSELLIRGKILNVQTFDGETYEQCKYKNNLGLNKRVVKGKIVLIGSKEVCIFDPGKEKKNLFRKSFASPLITGSICLNIQHSVKEKLAAFISVASNREIMIFRLSDFARVSSFFLPSNIPHILTSSITNSGNLVIKDSSYHSVLISLLKRLGGMADDGEVILYNSDHESFTRPQVNSLQWMRGTSYVTTAQLNRLFSIDREDNYSNPNLIHKFEEANYKVSDTVVQEVKKPSVPIQISRNRHLFRNASRKVGRKFGSIEEKFDNVAMSVGDTMNDAMEETSKDTFKSPFSF